MKKLIYIPLMLALIFQAKCMTASSLTSAASGNFNSSATWGGSTPSAGDTMTITSGHTLTVSSNLSYSGSAMFVIVYGTLNFNGGGSKLRMPSGSGVYIASGGSITSSGSGGGSSKIITSGSSTLWNSTQGTVSGPATLGVSPLPVTLISFNASLNENGTIHLNWTTASESNNDYFTLERSTNAIDFIELEKIAGKGNASSLSLYECKDLAAASGNIYYRLKQTDANGEEQLVASTVISMVAAPKTCQVWPNPCNGTNLNISAPASCKFILSDLEGKVVVQHNVAANVVNTADLNLPAGIYLYTINGEINTAGKLVVTR